MNVARELNVHFSTISSLRRLFKEFGDLSGQALAFVWDLLRSVLPSHESRFSLLRADVSVNAAVWVSGLLTSTLRITRVPRLAVGLWYGQTDTGALCWSAVPFVPDQNLTLPQVFHSQQIHQTTSWRLWVGLYGAPVPADIQ